MGEPLRNPPLVEALCEFRYARQNPWDWTIPGQLFDLIKERFPNRSEIGTTQFTIKAAEGAAAPILQTTPQRVQLRDSEGHLMVQVGQHLLAINHSPPYSDWPTFRRLILDVFEKYESVRGTGPIERIGLRYINRLEMSVPEFVIGDFITVDPPISGPLDKPLTNFYQRYELLHEAPPGVLIHQTGFGKADGKTFIMLDLDFGSPDVSKVHSTEEVARWVDKAHDLIEEAFIGSLNSTFYETLRRG